MDFGQHELADLMPPDFFLLGFLKERVFSNNPRSLQDIKLDTEETVAGIDQNILENLQET
jgi:hypothetical protein